MFRIALAALLWSMAMLASQAYGQSQEPGSEPTRDIRRYDIPAGPLTAVLNRFAREAGVFISGAAELTAGKSSPGLRGEYTVTGALQALLTGTGLAARFTDRRTVTLVKTAADSAGDTLSPITVSGKARRESAYGPVDGYVATRSATATKTDTPIMEVPASVQVVPRQVIEEQGALNLKDVYENVSSVQQAGNTLNAQTEVPPIIRGFESPNLLRNGLRSTQVGAVDLVEVERVEVLKGPASVLYGALEPGGIVNYVTKRPQSQPSHSYEHHLGSYDFIRMTGDTTGPLTDDGSLLYRLNAAYTHGDSFRDYMELDRTAVAPSLLWQPGEDTDLLLDFSYTREKQPYDAGIPLDTDGKRMVSRDTFFNDPDLDGRTNENYLAGYRLTHVINPVWSLSHQAQLHRADNANEALRPRGVGEVSGVEVLGLRYQNEDRRDDEAQLVLDATAKFATGGLEHTLLLGTELIYQESDFRRYRQNVDPVAISDDPDVNFDPPADQPRQVRLGETTWASLYVQDQMSLLADGRLKLLLGGRYDTVKTESETDDVASPDVDDDAFSGRAGLLYQFTDRYSAYASVSQSFNPQLPDRVDAGGTPLDPEEGLQYETGVKGAFFDQRLLATASVYRIEKDNVAVFDQDLFDDTGQIAYFPGVEQRSRGFELDLAGALTERIELIANYSYTDTEVLKNPGDPDAVGDPLGGVPRHKSGLWLNYYLGGRSFLSGLSLSGGVRHVGKSTAQFDSDLKLDSYTVVDAGARYSWRKARVSLNLYNLFDEDYIVRATNRAIAHPGAPFTVIGSVAIRF